MPNEVQALKKEVIGGDILFPGDEAPGDVAVSKIYKAICKVMIFRFILNLVFGNQYL